MICMISQHDHTDRLARGPPLSPRQKAAILVVLALLSWAVLIELIRMAFLFL